MATKSKDAFAEDFLKRVSGFSRKIGKEYFELVASEMRNTNISEWNAKEILTLHISALAEMVKNIIAVASCAYLDAPVGEKKKIALTMVRGYAAALGLPDFIADVNNAVESIEQELHAKPNLLEQLKQ